MLKKKESNEKSDFGNIKVVLEPKKYSFRIASAFFFVLGFAGIGVWLLMSSNASSIVGSITQYSNPDYITKFPFGSRSFYDQPYRGYSNTVPALNMVNAVGINYTPGDHGAADLAAASQIAHLLKDSGIKRARTALNWSSYSYASPDQLSNTAFTAIQNRVKLYQSDGIRPMFTIEAYDQDPDPNASFTGKFLVQPKVGDTTVKVDSATAAQIIPGLSGLDQHSKQWSKMMGVIFTKVSPSGVVTLSKPIDSKTDISGKMRVMRFGPFQKPFLADGVTPNPAFTATMNGWMNYVKDTANNIKTFLGNDNFDIEIWNELLNSSSFLDADTYYATSPDITATGDVKAQILKDTGAFFANPANGFPDVRVTNGFASQTPFPSAATNPDGITGLSKHYYAYSQRVFPAAVQYNSLVPLDALLKKDTSTTKSPWQDTFVPSYVAHYPEAWLGALDTQSEIRDMSPITTYVYGAPHGSEVTNADGQKSQVWATEWNISPQPDPQGLQPLATTYKGKLPSYTWDQNSLRYIQAKADIRYLSAFVNKGLKVVDFFHADEGLDKNNYLSMIDPAFINDVYTNPSTYPGDSAGGTIMNVLQRFTSAFSSAQPITQPQNITLDRLDDYSGNIQFKGNGTAAYPNLYNRDVFGYYPYQLTNSSFLIPLYIQTLDVEKIYSPGGSDTTKFDMPAETYQLTLGGVNGNGINSMSLYDPLTQAAPPVIIVSRSNTNIVIQVPVTDSPRLLYISESPVKIHPPKPPTVAIATPGQGASISGKVAVSATATTDPTTSVASVQYFIQGQSKPLSGLLTTAPYAYNWDTSHLISGPYTVYAKVQDALGNTAQSSLINVTVTNSFAKPVVKITSPTNKAIISGSINIQSMASSDPSTTVTSVQYLLDNVSISPLLKISNCSSDCGPFLYTWNTSTTTKVIHQLRAEVTDKLGNTGLSPIVNVIVR